jgi:phosphohistidine swiveling domain-containing protein
MLLLFSASNPTTTHHLEKSGAQGTIENSGSQVLVAGVAHSAGIPVLEAIPKADMTTTVGTAVSMDSARGATHHTNTAALEASSMAGVAPAAGAAATTGPTARASSPAPQIGASTTSPDDDDNVAEELEVIMGQPGLRTPGQVSLPEALGMAFFALHQVRDMVQRDRDGLDEDR